MIQSYRPKPSDVCRTCVPTRTCDRSRIGLGGLIWLSLLINGAAQGQTQGQSAKPTEVIQPPDGPRYETEIRPVLTQKCGLCHGKSPRKGDLNLLELAGLLRGGESGPAIVPGDPEKSHVFTAPRDGEMPPEGNPPLSAEELETIRLWIANGALAASNGASSDSSTSSISQHDVIPLLLLRCSVCHGGREREGGLDVRDKSALLRGGKSGPAITPGDPASSLLLKRIHAGEMPPRTRVVEVSVKPIESSEIETITRWITAGAPEVADTPDLSGTADDPLVSAADREFWSFRPPVAQTPPIPRASELVRNPIDAFVLAALEARDARFSPEASKTTLLRRASFDLTGLPPTPAEIREFLADDDPGAFEKVIERLLASPRYGERWSRDWLDVAGYADSEGKREQDIARPQAYRYRDYVIRAFDDDKPYDRFLLEQIAGDELFDYQNTRTITQDMADQLVATGFLRMAPDPTWANITGFVPDRLDVIADEVDILGASVLGLTLKCARCHSHKFDPLPHRDYYRLLAVFKGAFDEHDWLKPEIDFLSYGKTPERSLPFVSTAEREAWLASEAHWKTEVEAARAELEAQFLSRSKVIVEERIAQLPDVLRDDIRRTLATPAAERDAVQKYLAGKFEASLAIDQAGLATLDPEFKAHSERVTARIAAADAARAPEPRIRALWDRGEPSPTYIYRRGDYLHAGEPVSPGPPAVLSDPEAPFRVESPWPGAKSTGRRLAFAKWLTRPDHPLVARVIVNRVWRRHFGVGLVKTVSNFGKSGAPPSHPELLDWLAVEFVRSGYSVKWLHRQMMTSTTYRQSSSIAPTSTPATRDAAWLARMPVTRIDAEALHDSLLFVAGALDATRFGPASGTSANAEGLVTEQGTDRGWRRAIFVRQARKQVSTLLDGFDLPAMNPNCVARAESTVAPQALHLLNDRFVHDLAGRLADRLWRESGPAPERQIEQAYLIAFGRPADSEDLRAGSAALAELRDLWRAELAKRPASADAAPAGSATSNPQNDLEQQAARLALANYCHALLNAAEFLYVD